MPNSRRANEQPPPPLFSWQCPFILTLTVSNPLLPFHLFPYSNLFSGTVSHPFHLFRAHSLSVPLLCGYNQYFSPSSFTHPGEVFQPVHLLPPHFNSHSPSQFRFFWPSEVPGCVFLCQTINSSPKKINALKRKLGAFLTKWVLRHKEHLLLIGF